MRGAAHSRAANISIACSHRTHRRCLKRSALPQVKETLMTTLPLNGVRLRVRLVEVELSRLKLDPENPRLHSAYLAHDLPAKPNEKQIAAILEQLPEFQALLDAIT